MAAMVRTVDSNVSKKVIDASFKELWEEVTHRSSLRTLQARHAEGANIWQVKFAVNSSDCTVHSCTGIVHYTITYSLNGHESELPSSVKFYIQAPGKQTDVESRHVLGTVQMPGEIVDVNVKEVGCFSLHTQ